MHANVWGHIFLPCYTCSYTFILCTNVPFGKSMFHDLDPRSRLRGQGHSRHALKFLVWTIFSQRVIVTLSYLAQMFLVARQCVVTLTQGHDSKVKVTVDMH